jgi:type VI secretion system protein ImpC
MNTRHAFELSFTRTGNREGERVADHPPIRILVLGAFQGKESGEAAATLAPTAIRRIDIDNFDEVMEKLQPEADLTFDDPEQPAVRLVFESLEDFHPDRLVDRDPVLARLLGIRKRLEDAATFAAAAAELDELLGDGGTSPAEESGPEVAQPEHGTRPETDAETLDRLLGKAHRPTTEPQSHQRALVDEMIKRVVAPQVVSERANARAYAAGVEAAAGLRARRLLHHPDFQRLEAAWRSLFGIVSELDSPGDVEISLLSLDRQGLTEALVENQTDPDHGTLRGLLLTASTSAPDAEPWSLIVGDYTFGPTPRDIEDLAILGSVCHALGAAFLAGADATLLGCSDLLAEPDPRAWTHLQPEAGNAWKALRKSPGAQAIGLAIPRVLLRLPYGKDTDPCDVFPIEEMPRTPAHSDFLWGNPAFLCARALANVAARAGGQPAPVQYVDIDDLPAYILQHGSEQTLQPCAEVYLSASAGDAIAKAGCIPVFSYQRRNKVRIGPIHALAEMPTPGAGPSSRRD